MSTIKINFLCLALFVVIPGSPFAYADSRTVPKDAFEAKQNEYRKLMEDAIRADARLEALKETRDLLKKKPFSKNIQEAIRELDAMISATYKKCLEIRKSVGEVRVWFYDTFPER